MKLTWLLMRCVVCFHQILYSPVHDGVINYSSSYNLFSNSIEWYEIINAQCPIKSSSSSMNQCTIYSSYKMWSDEWSIIQLEGIHKYSFKYENTNSFPNDRSNIELNHLEITNCYIDPQTMKLTNSGNGGECRDQEVIHPSDMLSFEQITSLECNKLLFVRSTIHNRKIFISRF